MVVSFFISASKMDACGFRTVEYSPIPTATAIAAVAVKAIAQFLVLRFFFSFSFGFSAILLFCSASWNSWMPWKRSSGLTASASIMARSVFALILTPSSLGDFSSSLNSRSVDSIGLTPVSI